MPGTSAQYGVPRGRIRRQVKLIVGRKFLIDLKYWQAGPSITIKPCKPDHTDIEHLVPRPCRIEILWSQIEQPQLQSVAGRIDCVKFSCSAAIRLRIAVRMKSVLCAGKQS